MKVTEHSNAHFFEIPYLELTLIKINELAQKVGAPANARVRFEYKQPYDTVYVWFLWGTKGGLNEEG